ncbi:MAG: PD40 domain-containing protein [Candidatus Lindowbacteria bacterium]|nr:PD40 domain-containing protein [Candidatus Lindowbacteria bacterium]
MIHSHHKSHVLIASITLSLILCAAGNSISQPPSKTIQRKVTKTPVFDVPILIEYKIAADEGVLAVSPDAKTVAYAYKYDETGRPVVIWNGKEFGPYDHIGALKFSPDAKRLAYVAQEKGSEKVFMVVDGKKGRKYDSIDDATTKFSADSKRLAYLACNKKKCFMVIDGKEDSAYPSIERGSFIFSSNNKRYAYRCQAEGGWRVVVDGRLRKDRVLWGGYLSGMLAQGDADRPVFSPDSKRVAYKVTFAGFNTSAIHQPKKSFSFVDGDKLDGSFCCFSPDGKQVAYVSEEENYQEALVIKKMFSKKGKSYTRGTINSVTFSPDSKRVAYAAYEGSESFVVLDDVEQKRHKGYTAPAMVEGVIYATPVGQKDRATEPEDRGVVENSLTFSPDGKRFAYVISKGGRNVLVLDGAEAKTHNYQWYSSVLSRPVFSSDSKHVAYPAYDQQANEYYVVLDGQASKKYRSIKYGSLMFSPDNKHLAYVVEDDDGFVVVAGSEGTERGVYSKVIFDSPTRLHYLTRNGRQIYLVSEELRG